jgi:hypothetical protein
VRLRALLSSSHTLARYIFYAKADDDDAEEAEEEDAPVVVAIYGGESDGIEPDDM